MKVLIDNVVVDGSMLDKIQKVEAVYGLDGTMYYVKGRLNNITVVSEDQFVTEFEADVIRKEVSAHNEREIDKAKESAIARITDELCEDASPKDFAHVSTFVDTIHRSKWTLDKTAIGDFLEWVSENPVEVTQ